MGLPSSVERRRCRHLHRERVPGLLPRRMPRATGAAKLDAGIRPPAHSGRVSDHPRAAKPGRLVSTLRAALLPSRALVSPVGRGQPTPALSQDGAYVEVQRCVMAASAFFRSRQGTRQMTKQSLMSESRRREAAIQPLPYGCACDPFERQRE
jgi:hypothetical protein